MTHYPDWGGRTNNILALSELSFAVALAYDWIYDDLNEAQRSQLNTAIRDHALAVALDWYRGEFRHNGEHNNINLVDNGGLGLLALTVADEPETGEQALEVIQSTFQKAQYALRHYTEDGSWPEGPAYWHYGGQYLAMYIQGLNKSLGTDYGLSLPPGYEASGAYPYHLLGEGGVFNFMMAASATTCMNPYGSPRSSTNLNTPGLLAISMSGRATSTLSIWCFMNPACSKRLRRSWIVSSPGLNRPPCEAPGTILMPCLLP